MIVRAEKRRAFHADGPITKRGPFRGAGNYADVLRHDVYHALYEEPDPWSPRRLFAGTRA